MKIVDISERYGHDDKVLSGDTANCLRKWLELAESGQIVSVAIVGEMKDGDMVTGHTRSACQYQVVGAMDALKLNLLDVLHGKIDE